MASAAVAAAGYVSPIRSPARASTPRRSRGAPFLVMLADSMMPEAFRHGGKTVGLMTVLGYLVAAVLGVAS